MRNILLPSIRIPYNLTKGSLAERNINSGKFTDKIYESISSGINSNRAILKFETIQSKLSELIPGVKIKVKQDENANCEAIVDLIGDKKGKACGFLLAIKSPKSQVKVDFLPKLIHEIQHISDYLYNPKLLARDQKLFNTLGRSNKYSNFYDKYMYNEYPFDEEASRRFYISYISKALNDFVKSANKKVIIDYLQDVRYSLRGELLAYKKQKEYAYKLSEKGFKIKTEDFSERVKYFMFEEKIKLVETVLFDLISKQRLKNAQKIKNNKFIDGTSF